MISRRRFCHLSLGLAATMVGCPSAMANQSPAGQPASAAPGFPTNGWATAVKIVGVGGFGEHLIQHMIPKQLQGVEFVSIDTRSAILDRSRAASKILLGNGAGAGGQPEVARHWAMSDRARIAEVLTGTQMVFVVAGMGGGTGSGVSPVVAEIAHSLGVITIGLVTTPFAYEGRRMQFAKEGIDELKKYADTVIPCSNEALEKTLGPEVSMGDAFDAVDSWFELVIRKSLERCHTAAQTFASTAARMELGLAQ
jgi:cell division GTPase FtsZ